MGEGREEWRRGEGASGGGEGGDLKKGDKRGGRGC